jgi:hypothetical protein
MECWKGDCLKVGFFLLCLLLAVLPWAGRGMQVVCAGRGVRLGEPSGLGSGWWENEDRFILTDSG